MSFTVYELLPSVKLLAVFIDYFKLFTKCLNSCYNLNSVFLFSNFSKHKCLLEILCFVPIHFNSINVLKTFSNWSSKD